MTLIIVDASPFLASDPINELEKILLLKVIKDMEYLKFIGY